jgi:hypothetical protein
VRRSLLRVAPEFHNPAEVPSSLHHENKSDKQQARRRSQRRWSDGRPITRRNHNNGATPLSIDDGLARA